MSSELSQFMIELWTVSDSQRSSIIPDAFDSANPMYYRIDPYLVMEQNATKMIQFSRNQQCDFYDYINDALNTEEFDT